MKTELKKLAEELAAKLENEAEGKSTFDLHNDALSACYELCRAIGSGHSPEELPAIADLYSLIVDTLPGAELYFRFWKEEEGEEAEECATWAECTRAELTLCEVSLPHVNHGKLEDMGSSVASCIFNALGSGYGTPSFERDGETEWLSLSK